MADETRMRSVQWCVIATTLLVIATSIRDTFYDRHAALVAGINETNANLVEAIKLSRCRCGMIGVKAEANGNQVTIQSRTDTLAREIALFRERQLQEAGKGTSIHEYLRRFGGDNRDDGSGPVSAIGDSGGISGERGSGDRPSDH